jgi:hypothetical protein
MIPAKTDPKWAKLVKGEIKHSFNNVPAGLMVSRLQRETVTAADQQTLRRCIDEVYAFFEKYEAILRADIATIFGQEG